MRERVGVRVWVRTRAWLTPSRTEICFAVLIEPIHNPSHLYMRRKVKGQGKDKGKGKGKGQGKGQGKAGVGRGRTGPWVLPQCFGLNNGAFGNIPKYSVKPIEG